MPQLEVNVVEMSTVSDELSATKREVRPGLYISPRGWGPWTK
jgi:hypothetical protein